MGRRTNGPRGTNHLLMPCPAAQRDPLWPAAVALAQAAVRSTRAEPCSRRRIRRGRAIAGPRVVVVIALVRVAAPSRRPRLSSRPTQHHRGGRPCAPKPVGHPKTDLSRARFCSATPSAAPSSCLPTASTSRAGADQRRDEPLGRPGRQADQALPVTEETRADRQLLLGLHGKHLLYQQEHRGDENFHVFRVDVSRPALPKVTDVTRTRARAARSSISASASRAR